VRHGRSLNVEPPESRHALMSRPTVADEDRSPQAFCALKFKPERQSLGDAIWRERVLGLEQDSAAEQRRCSYKPAMQVNPL